jgi:hypothetical protein
MMKLFIPIVGFLFLLGISSCQNDAAELINVVSHAVPTANAGPSVVIQLPINTATLSGTGSSQNGPVASYMWSFVSGPSIPIIQSPGAKITRIDSLTKEGRYIFRLSVIDSAGFIGVDTATITVKPDPSAPQTLLLSISGNNNEQNFAVFNGNNASFQNTELLAYSSTAGTLFQRARGAFKFDLTTIPVGSTIITARLNLYSNPTPTTVLQAGSANGGTNNAFSIMRLRSAWNTGTTWGLQPDMDSSTLVSVPPIPHTNLPSSDVEIDVKPIINAMLNPSQGNFGFMIALQNEFGTNLRNFASSTHAITAKRPKLTIVYQ